MKRIGVVFLLVALGVLLSATAHAQQLRRGTLSGTIVSRSANVPGNGSVTVYTTPASDGGVFILTQVWGWDPGCVTLRGETFGVVSQPGMGAAPSRFEPGIALPANEKLICQEACGLQGTYCAITGILSPR